MKIQSRRSFLKATIGSGVGLAVFPSIIPARLFGDYLENKVKYGA
jgi:hypothetical protein